MGIQYNGEPASQEVPLMTTQYNNLFAQYDFATADDHAVWDSFNTTYGWESDTPPLWVSSSSTGGNPLAGILQFELSPELSDLRDYTIQMWARWDGTGDANQRIFEFGRDSQNYMYLKPASIGGGVEFVIAVDGVENVLQASDPLTPNQWEHVAVAFSGNTVKLYVNGSAVATNTSVTMDPHQVRANYALLGRGLAGNGFHGMVDMLRVYSDARTASEILTDVRATYPGYVPGSDAPPDVAPFVPGDFNRDGIVDAADYTLWRDQLGQIVIPGTSVDGTGDGTVDAGDYDVWVANFGHSAQGSGAGASAQSALKSAAATSPASTIASIATLPSTDLSNAGARDTVFHEISFARRVVAASQDDLANLDWLVSDRGTRRTGNADSSSNALRFHLRHSFSPDASDNTVGSTDIAWADLSSPLIGRKGGSKANSKVLG
jgi:Concanavalin A-like lectin/glucanases superfamily/Dockerin type I domain